MNQHQGVCSRGGCRGVCPPGTAAVFKLETGAETKQTIGAPKFMVSFALRGGGRGSTIGEGGEVTKTAPSGDRTT